MKGHPNYFQRHYCLGYYDLFVFLRIVPFMTSYHSPFPDSQIQVNKEFFTTDYTRVHLPFLLASFLLPSHSSILEIIQKSEQGSCHQWCQHPQPASRLCSPQGSQVARACPGGLAPLRRITMAHLCLALYSQGTFTWITARDPDIIVIKYI